MICINKKRITEKIIKTIGENIEEIKEQRNNFEFDIKKIEEKIEELNEQIEILEKEILGNTRYKRLGKLEMQRIKEESLEGAEKIKKLKSMKSARGRLEGIRDILKNKEDYTKYEIKSGERAYMCGFQFPTQNSKDVFGIMKENAGITTYYTSSYFLGIRAINAKECYKIENEEDRERIRKIKYIEKAVEKAFEEEYGYRIGLEYVFSYLALGEKMFVNRVKLKEDNVNNSCYVERFQSFKEELIEKGFYTDEIYEEIERAKSELEYILYFDELIEKVLAKYECIWEETEETSMGYIPF